MGHYEARESVQQVSFGVIYLDSHEFSSLIPSSSSWPGGKETGSGGGWILFQLLRLDDHRDEEF